MLDRHEFSIDDPSSIWYIVNKSRPVTPRRYRPTDLISVGNNQQMRGEAAGALARLFRDAELAGMKLVPLSGFRSFRYQQRVYKRIVSYRGPIEAARRGAKPGVSEHQTGLAIDVGGGGCGIEDAFAATAEGIWLAGNAHRHGFTIRYPRGKEAVTGYRYEPWHIRYFGTALAHELHATGAVAEEFFLI